MGEPTKHSPLKCSLFLVFLLVMAVLGLVGFYVIWPAEHRCPEQRVGPQSQSPGFLDMLEMTDGLDVRWYQYDGSLSDLKTAVAEAKYQMFTTEVLLRQGSTSEIFAGSGNSWSTTLGEWLDAVLSSPGKGVQIEFKSDDQVEPVLKILSTTEKRTSSPVWLKVKVRPGNGTGVVPVNFTRFSERVNQLLPSAFLALDWTLEDTLGDMYTKPMVKAMWDLCKDIRQPVSVVVSARILGISWTNLRWLLGKSETITLSVTTPSATSSAWTEELAYELLMVRNDFDKTRIFYDFGSDQNLASFKSLSVTARSPLHHFDVDNDAARITWAHAVNSREKLNTALKKGILFLEADVLLRGQGTPNQTNIPVMAHPPAIDSDITLAEWLDLVAKTDRGIKLDFKSVEALEPSMVLLNERRSKLQQPVWLNADILPGPNAAGVTPRNATQFLAIVNNNFPQATLSLGWTTGWSNSGTDEGYSEAMVNEMDNVCQTLLQPITFPVRAAAAKSSWCQLKGLLDRSRRYTATIWTSASDAVAQDDMNYIRLNSEKSRVYFDLPEDLMPDV